MDYAEYTVEDFICDESFLRYCLNPDHNDIRFWESWISNNPGKRGIVEKAIDFIREVRSSRPSLNDERYSEGKDRIRRRLLNEINGGSEKLTIL
jgi:hypothetical protein